MELRHLFNSARYFRNGGLLLLALSLGSCLGTEAKNLGNNKAKNTASSNIADPFAVSLVFRDISTDATTPSLIVQIQGVRGVSAALFENTCGGDGSNCTCDFYTSSTASAVSTLGVVTLSSQNNSITCTINDVAANAPTYKFVRLRTLNSNTTSGFLSIPITAPTLSEVIQGLDTTKVRKISSYQCNLTFLEGESVSPSGVTCAPSGHHLGFIYTKYFFYLFSGNAGADSNFSSRAGQEFYPSGAGSAICGLTIPLYDCTTSSPALKFGLYKESSGPFNVPLTLNFAPNASASTPTGFAALPDNAGNCPIGMVKIRPYVATPPSLVIGTNLNGAPATQPYPTNFINAANGKNSTIIDTAPPSSNYTLDRQENTVGCSVSVSGNFNCSGPPSGGIQLGALSIPFVAQSPILCALPASLISSLP